MCQEFQGTQGFRWLLFRTPDTLDTRDTLETFMKLLIIGAGYVGLTQAACLAHLGHDVFCVEIDADKVARLRSGEVPFFEPGLTELVEEGLLSGKLIFDTDLKRGFEDCAPEIIFVCVNTPLGDDGHADLTAVQAVCRDIGSLAQSDIVVVIKSTVPPGKTEEILSWINNDRVTLASNPEFLREGKAVEDFLHPDRTLIGAEDEKTAVVLTKIYENIDAPTVCVSIATAQLAKYASNTMLAMRLSLMNEFAVIADLIGADIRDVEDIIGMDDRIGSKFLRAGAGFGGSCFPKDVLALARVAKDAGYDPLLIDPIISVNHAQPIRFVEKMETILGGLASKKIAVWGVTFNKDTDDVRESPALTIITELVKRGASISVFDPAGLQNAKGYLQDTVAYADDKHAALEGADTLAVLTEWSEFADSDWSKVATKIKMPTVFDGKNFLPRVKLEGSGLTVHGMGLCTKDRRHPQLAFDSSSSDSSAAL